MFHGQVSKAIADGLLALKSRIQAADIPTSKLDETLNIATWNIREFGRRKRSDAAIHYVAEILGQFDLIGVVELRDNLEDLSRVLEILGPYWRSVYSDMIPDPAATGSASPTSTTSGPLLSEDLPPPARRPARRRGRNIFPKNPGGGHPTQPPSRPGASTSS